MKNSPSKQQARLLSHAVRQSWRTLLAAGLCSGAINVLALTGPIYMLEIYNDVLPSGSAERLALLTLLMLGLYAASGFLDFGRARLMSTAGLRVDGLLSNGVFAVQQKMALESRHSDGLQPLRDLDQIRSFVASAGPTAIFDLPWMPLYLCVIYAMHPLLGGMAAAGALVLFGLMLLTEMTGRSATAAASLSMARRWSFAASAHRNAEAARAMGINSNLQWRWNDLNAIAGRLERDGARATTAVAAAIKVARPALQSALLGLGAYLFLRGEASAGAMIASSIILSRALAPLETAIAHWRGFSAARQSCRRLTGWLAAQPETIATAPRPAPPSQDITVENLSVAPPGASLPTIRNATFTLRAGDGLGIVGPSGSGKSTLALVGVWPAHTGAIELDGHAFEAWDSDALGRHIGYVPQDVALFGGSIADNISRFDADASERAIVSAARAAGVHEMILRLDNGYATDVGENGAVLSAGQRQRIALARALYKDPFLVVLDEPNSNLDAEGDACLNAAIASVRRRGAIVIVVAHRKPALAAIDQVLALAKGRVVAFGDKESVLARVLRPARAACYPVTAPEAAGDNAQPALPRPMPV